MNGIEKISARILADAETEAAAIRAQAGEKAAQLRADYDRRIELEQQRLTAEAQAEADKQLERDQGAARMAARRQLLETKQALVDAAFRQARESLIVVNAHRINHGEYPDYNEKGKDFFMMFCWICTFPG